MKTPLNPEINPSNVKVLVVDDIPLNVLLIQKMLTQFQFDIRTANDGQSALDSIAADMPDLVLLDLMMPGINGYEVIKRLRADSKTENLPIIILSALNSNDDVVKGFNLGANDFITKPIIMERLLNSVATQINLGWAQKKIMGNL